MFIGSAGGPDAILFYKSWTGFGLKDKIPGIRTLDWGTNVSPEKHDKGFTHCFVLTFATEKVVDRHGREPHGTVRFAESGQSVA